MQPQGIRVLIADDHAAFLDTLREILSLEPAVSIVAEGSDGQEALSLSRSEKPDIAILDVGMPGLDGIAVCRALTAGDAPAVILLTLHKDRELQRRARAAGVRGFVLKDYAALDVVPALRAVMAGEIYAGRQCTGFAEPVERTTGGIA